MTENEIRTAIESADTYQAAAVALGMQYPKLYATAKKLGAKPRNIAAKKVQRHPPASGPARSIPDLTRKPVPESPAPVLGPWVPPAGADVKPDVVLVRFDQAGRVRAEVSDLAGGGWCSWAVRDVTGAVVGKMGLVSGMSGGDASTAVARLNAETGADAALVKFGWLPGGHAVPVESCNVPAPVCLAPSASRPKPEADPIVALAERLLSARRAERADLGTELARLVMVRVTEAA